MKRPRQLSRRRKLFFLIIGLMMATCTALFLGEVGLRIYHGELLTTRSLRLNRGLVERAPAIYHPRLGWTSRPGPRPFHCRVDRCRLRACSLRSRSNPASQRPRSTEATNRDPVAAATVGLGHG